MLQLFEDAHWNSLANEVRSLISKVVFGLDPLGRWVIYDSRQFNRVVSNQPIQMTARCPVRHLPEKGLDSPGI